MSDQKKRLNKIFTNLELCEDGIYNSNFTNLDQQAEIALREDAASVNYDDYLEIIRVHHSIPVMDWEVRRVLHKLPKESIVLDIGGCFGWHWRNIASDRPDIKVVIVDFIRQNLTHAYALLGELINDQISLVHGDATQLPFYNDSFDLIWTVQTFQHIPNFESAIRESFRCIKRGGVFINYSLNRARLIQFIYLMIGRTYHIKGNTDVFYLELASKIQKEIIESVFAQPVVPRYTEILFHPDLKLSFIGKENGFPGKVDARLSGNLFFLGWIARQCAFEVYKL